MWLSTSDLPLKTECKKLAPHFIGPFPISKVINPVAVQFSDYPGHFTSTLPCMALE